MGQYTATRKCFSLAAYCLIETDSSLSISTPALQYQLAYRITLLY